MAEVLITLGIIGIVAALTIPSLITNIKNKGYIERLKKTQATLQTVTNQLANEGTTFLYDSETIAKEQGSDAAMASLQSVVDAYASKMKVATVCKYHNSYTETPCHIHCGKYKFLNNNSGRDHYLPFMGTFPILLQDGTSIGIRFQNQIGGMTMWHVPAIRFAVDVNGKKGPNMLGRDIFYLYYDNKRIKPAGDGNTKIGVFGQDDYNKEGLGIGCAYKVLMEGKINY